MLLQMLLFSLRVYPRDRFKGPSFLIFFLTICSLILIVLICPTMLIITKFFSDRDPEVVKFVIDGDLAVASRQFDDNKLVLNPEKCKCIILPKSYPSDLSFSINDEQVPIVDHLDLLGVTIVNSLNFSKHIAKITN